MAHTVHCAHDDCDEYSCRAPFRPEPPDLQAIAHRAALAADGWGDVEGRDYCPDHNPHPAAAPCTYCYATDGHHVQCPRF